MKKKFKWLLAALIVVVSGGAYAFSMMKPAAVEAETAVPGDMSISFTAQGTVTPENSSVLNSGSNGQILELEGQPGKLLEEGSVIARIGGGGGTELELQREQYRQQLSSARKQYDTLYGERGSAKSQEDAARSQYNLAEKNYNNAKTLADQGGYVSQSDLNALKTLLDVAKEALTQAQEANSASSRAYYKEQIASYEKQLETMDSTISEEEIKMPYQGILWETYTDTGAYVAQNQPVVKIYQPGNMKITASLLAEDAVLLKEGMTARIEYADGKETEGTVTFISQVAGQKLSSIGLEENRCSVELKPSEVPEGIGAGYQADVTFNLVTASQVFSVPAAAVVASGGSGSAVYLIKENKATMTLVETGEKSGGRIQILSGIGEGDQVITDPYGSSVKQGSRVEAEE